MQEESIHATERALFPPVILSLAAIIDGYVGIKVLGTKTMGLRSSTSRQNYLDGSCDIFSTAMNMAECP